MKSIVLTENQKFALQEISLPPLSPNLCRVQIAHVGICSSDISRSHENGAYQYPLVMGHEFSGIIVQTGSEVENLSVGQRVAVFPLIPCFECEFCEKATYPQCKKYSYYGSRVDGAYSEYLDALPWNLLPIPDSVSLANAATLEPLAVVIHALKKSFSEKSVSAQAKVLILGAGFLGLLAAMILRNRFPQVEVTLADRNQFKLDLGNNFSHRQVLLKTEEEKSSFAQVCKDSYELVFEMTGAPNLFELSIQMAKAQGQVIWCGNIGDRLELPQKTVSSVLRKELSVKGSWNSTYNPKAESDDWREALNAISDGLDPSSLITKFISLEEVPEILKKMHLHKTSGAEFPAIKFMVRNDIEII